jgi:hypothetical protein
VNTLDDLRATLAHHAPAEDTALLDRTSAVRSRVQVVRRRRRVSAVGGAVAALAIVAAGIALPRLVGDRGDSDLAAATTVTVDGFEYRLVRVVESKPGQKSLDVDVPRKDSDQVIALLADGLGGGRATLQNAYDDSEGDPWEGQPGDRIVKDGANPAIPMPVYFDDASPALRFRLKVEAGTARTQVGVAFYERTDRMPKGVLAPNGTTVFRQRVGSRRLLSAAFAKPGEAEVTFSFTGRIDQTALEGLCTLRGGGGPAGPPWVNLAIDDRGPVSWGGCHDPAEDAGSGSTIMDDPSDGRHTVRVWVSEEVGGTPHVYPGMTLGGAAYDDSDAVIVNGARVDPVIEFDGRTWELDRHEIARSVPNQHSLTISSSSDEPVLLGYAANHVARVDATVDGAVSSTDGGFSNEGSGDGGPAVAVSTVLLPGGRGTYELTWPRDDADAQVAILLYRVED